MIYKVHNLVIDIGNSNSKWAVFSNDTLVYQQSAKRLKITVLTNLIKKYNVKNSTIANVNESVTAIEDFLKKTTNYIPFGTKITAGITNNYQTNNTLGLDRWAKIIAVSRLFNNNCLIIDAGTCITYDVLTEKKEYLGGSISLGIKMRFKALHHYTKRLPLLNWNTEEKEIPKGLTTNTAIKSGVLQGITNEIEGFIALENKKNKNLKVIITGGDAEFLYNQLKNGIFALQIIYDPYLVLKGLNEAITTKHV